MEQRPHLSKIITPKNCCHCPHLICSCSHARLWRVLIHYIPFGVLFTPWPQSRPCACVPSHFSCIWLFVTPRTVARQDPLSIGFSRQEYWSELLCPPPGIFPTLGLNLCLSLSPALASRFFTASATWEAQSRPHLSPSPCCSVIFVMTTVILWSCIIVISLQWVFNHRLNLSGWPR